VDAALTALRGDLDEAEGRQALPLPVLHPIRHHPQRQRHHLAPRLLAGRAVRQAAWQLVHCSDDAPVVFELVLDPEGPHAQNVAR
jgi:hypothetical protein